MRQNEQYPANDWRILAQKIQNRTIWVDHSRQCVSFRAAAGFSRIVLRSDYELLGYIFTLVEQGYCFQ